MADTVLTDPRLPRELERMIFETAALSGGPQSIHILMLVAARVKEWVDPLLYSVVLIYPGAPQQLDGFPVFSPPAFLRAVEKKTASFFRDAVRHVYLGYNTPSPEVRFMITTCTRLTTLFLGCDPGPYLAAFATLQELRRLAIDFRTLLEGHEPHFIFRNVTHLELLDLVPSPFTVGGMTALPARLLVLPHLTHAAFAFTPQEPQFYAGLHANTSSALCCIVMWATDPHATRHLAHDVRFVCIAQQTAHQLDWLRGAHGGEDYWALADAFIAARREGRVDSTSYIVFDTDDLWRRPAPEPVYKRTRRGKPSRFM